MRRARKGVKAMYLKELTELDGVSGDEGRVRDFIKEKIEGKVDSVKVDVPVSYTHLDVYKRQGLPLTRPHQNFLKP